MASDKEFMMERFRRYYSKNHPYIPTMFKNREFGFMFFDRSFVQRHMAFTSDDALYSFLQMQVPSHSYHSTAYYHFPGAATMEDKQWIGADLIFDLDADHIPGAELMSYDEMLARIKIEVLRLVDDFLLGDLGFDASHLRIVFSGGRGYHIHVSDPRVASLKSHERREIVDYIAGNNLNMDWVFPTKTVSVTEIKGRVQESRVRCIPPRGSGGWKGKMRIGIAWLIEEMRSLDVKELRARLPYLNGHSESLINGMLKDLYEKRGERSGSDMLLEKNIFDCFTNKRYEDLFIGLLEYEVIPRFRCEIDEPVTADIKRLIRLPGSLHGKSGLKVVPMERDDLDDFNPLLDAVPETYTDREIEVFLKRKVDITIRGKRITGEGICRVPEYAAMFLIGRKEATLEFAESLE